MTPFSRILGTVLLGSAVGLPMLASSRGWGVGSERNARIIKEVNKSCPAHMRRVDGTCRRGGHRSYYYGRSYVGGGPHRGK